MIPESFVADCSDTLADVNNDKFKSFNFGELGVSPEIEEYAVKYAK